jgi:phosphoglycerate dehydrogenase-like enzyme
MPEPFHPRRVVIGSSAHAQLAQALHRERPDLELRGRTLADVTAEDLDWGEVYVGFKRPPLPTMGRIRWVHCTGAGVDAWLYPTPLPPEILLTRTSEPFGPMIAEWALARALAFSQHLGELAECQRRAEWCSLDPAFMRGSRAVVVGTGDVGSSTARAFAALGAVVHGVSRSGKGDSSVFAAVHPVSELAEIVGGASWLILALPLTAATRKLVDRRVLQACRGAVLINAGRGAVVDEAVIPEALDQGWLSGAALDVFEIEPLPQSSPLWNHPRVMISPHISGPTTTEGAATGFLECLSEVERGVRPARIVDRDRQY